MYSLDVLASLPVVLQSGGYTYVYGLDLISATDAQGDQTYFLYDGLGSVTDLTDDEGDVVDGYTYDVFGAIRSQSGSSANPWLFTGEQLDADEGLYYLRARYYDSETGRFLGRDPLPLGNPYAYVANNPVNLVDPAGLQAAGNAAAAACAAAAVYGGTATAATAGGGGVTVVAAGGGVTAVCAGALAVAVCDAGGCELLADVAGAAGSAIIGAGEAVVEGAGDVIGEVGDWLGFGKKSKPEPKPIKIRWTDEDPFPVFYPTTFQLLPPEWKCWGRYHPLVCLGIAGGAVTVGAGRTLDFWDLFLNQIDRLLGEKMRGR